jgi:hypothetical protein
VEERSNNLKTDLRRIFETKKSELHGEWRILHNEKPLLVFLGYSSETKGITIG